MSDRRSGMFKHQEIYSVEERRARLEARLRETLALACQKAPAVQASWTRPERRPRIS